MEAHDYAVFVGNARVYIGIVSAFSQEAAYSLAAAEASRATTGVCWKTTHIEVEELLKPWTGIDN